MTKKKCADEHHLRRGNRAVDTRGLSPFVYPYKTRVACRQRKETMLILCAKSEFARLLLRANGAKSRERKEKAQMNITCAYSPPVAPAGRSERICLPAGRAVARL